MNGQNKFYVYIYIYTLPIKNIYVTVEKDKNLG